MEISREKIYLCLSSFTAFSLIHFAAIIIFSSFLNFVKKLWQPYFLLFIVTILSILSLIGYSIIAGYYTGVSNWGEPIDYKLFSDILFRPFSFVGLLLVHEKVNQILAGSLIVTLIIFAYYFWRRKDLLAIADSFAQRKFIPLAFSLIPIIILYFTTSIDKQKISDSIFIDDIFLSFVHPTDPIDNLKKIDGLGNVDFDFEKIENFDKKNVIIFSVECLRADHLSFNGYHRKTTPYLDALHKEGKLVDMKLSTSTCASTFCGILTTLNSCSFSNLGYFKFGIHDYLKKQGYHINFLLSGLHDSFTNLKTHYGNNIDTYIESKHYPKYGLNDDEFLFAALNNIQNYNGQPNFFFVHMMSPHIAGKKNKKFQVYNPTFDYNILFRKSKRAIDVNSDAVTLYTNNYDNSIMQADDVIKRFLAKLKSKGFMDNALVVIMGDHGESLGEHNGLLGHKSGLWQEYIGVPILFIDNDKSYYTDKSYASQIDIAPTIVDRLQLPIPEHWEGKSMHQAAKNRITYHETKNENNLQVLALVEQRNKQIHKYIYIPKTGKQYFYNLRNDPTEKKNLINSCKDSLRYVNLLKDYYGSSSLEKAKTYAGKTKTTTGKGEKQIKYGSFITKNFIKEHLGVEGNIFHNFDKNSTEYHSTHYFTWNENKNTNTIMIELSDKVVKGPGMKHVLKNGIHITDKKTKKVRKLDINNKEYLMTYDFQDILKFQNNQRTRISVQAKNNSKINKEALVRLVDIVHQLQKK